MKRFGVLIAALLAVCMFFVLYQYDNKYTHPGPQADHGVLLLEEDAPELLYLVDGWEFYSGRLLSPEDFAGNPPAPDEYIYIGQYYGFDRDDPAQSPYGSATYRLNIFTGTSEVRSYALELPEIFSAYRLWINGELLIQNGEPDPDAYAPGISRGSISFAAGERIDIVFAVTNYGHYYSGLIYPPAFGGVREVAAAVNASVVNAALRCLLAAAVGLLCFCLGGFLRDKRAAIAFGALCFLYVGSAWHPLMSFLVMDTRGIWYAIEDFCFYMLHDGFCYVGALLFLPKSRLMKIIPAIGCLFALGVVAAAVLLPAGMALSAMWLSVCIAAYKMAVICFLSVILLKPAKTEKYATVLLAAVAVFSVSLAVDTATILYEPIRFGWPTEIGSFVMICVLGAALTLDAIKGLRERIVLQANNEKLDMSYALLTEKIEQTQKNHHDLRHHMAALSVLAQRRDIDGITSYLSDYTQSLPTGGDLHFSQNAAIDAVLRYYHAMALGEGVDIRMELRLPDSVPEQELCVLIGNLLENAVEACRYVAPDQRYIRFTTSEKGGFLIILCDNSCEGIIKKDALGGGASLLSRKRGDHGVGTASVAAIAKKHGGKAEFTAEHGEFRANVLLDMAIHDVETSQVALRKRRSVRYNG
jgi:hypothetical protein